MTAAVLWACDGEGHGDPGTPECLLTSTLAGVVACTEDDGEATVPCVGADETLGGGWCATPTCEGPFVYRAFVTRHAPSATPESDQSADLAGTEPTQILAATCEAHVPPTCPDGSAPSCSWVPAITSEEAEAMRRACVDFANLTGPSELYATRVSVTCWFDSTGVMVGFQCEDGGSGTCAMER